MKLWLTVKELANLEGISERAIQKKLSKYTKTREVPGKRGGRSGTRVEIHISSLPAALQVQWVKENTPLHPPQGGKPTPDPSQEGKPTPSPSQEGKKTEVNLLEYPDWAVKQFQERKALLEGMDIVVAETRRAGGKVREAKIAYAKAQGVSRSTLYRLEKQRNEGGMSGLLPKIPARRPDKEALTDGMKSAIWNLVCTQQRRSTMQVLRRLQEYCQAHKEACPSYSTVYRFVHRKIPQATRDYYRKGVTSWRNLHEPIVHRDYSTLEVNELWCGDHRQLDVFVKTFQGTGVNAHWTVRAPWITMFLDLKSWCIVGWHLSYQPDSYTIALALRHGILQVGIPQGIYVDNGKDYRSMFLKGLSIKTKSIGTVGNNDDIQAYLDVASIQRNTPGILELLGIEARHSQPVSKDRPASGGMPRSKPIETAFNWFPEHLERECPGWRGNAPGKISERARKEIKHRELLTLEQLEELVAATIEEHNHQPHGWRDKPAVAFYKGASVIKVHDPRTLDILLRPTKAVKVRNSEVKLNGIPYQHEELYKWSGQKVVLRYDPLDLSNLVIMSPGRPAEFICVATNAPLMSWAPTSEQYKEYVVSRRKEARKVVKQKKDAEVTMAMEQQELFLQGLEENRAVAAGGAPALPGGKKYVLRQENFSSTRGGKPTPNPSQEGNMRKGPKTKMKKIFPEFREAAEAVEAEKRHHQQAQQAAAEREASGEEPEDLLLKYYGPDSRIAQLNKREFEERDAGYYQPYDNDDDFPPEDEPEKPEWLKLFEEAQAKEAQAKGKEG